MDSGESTLLQGQKGLRVPNQELGTFEAIFHKIHLPHFASWSFRRSLLLFYETTFHEAEYYNTRERERRRRREKEDVKWPSAHTKWTFVHTHTISMPVWQ